MITFSGTNVLESDTDTLVLERRRSNRIRLVRPITLVDALHGRHVSGKTRDVSACGLRVEVPAALNVRPGDSITVDVSSLAGTGLLDNRRNTVAARVVWTRRQNKLVRPMLTVGLEFITELDAQLNVA